jgi:hypothetical protein
MLQFSNIVRDHTSLKKCVPVRQILFLYLISKLISSNNNKKIKVFIWLFYLLKQFEKKVSENYFLHKFKIYSKSKKKDKLEK